MRAQHDLAHVGMPGVHRVASLFSARCMTPSRGSRRIRAPRRLPQRAHVPLQPTQQLRCRGLLFDRLLERAILADPITYRSLTFESNCFARPTATDWML